MNTLAIETIQTSKPIHPAWMRVAHWLNAIAVVIMVMSGWKIYNAAPIFESIEFPNSITLGDWLGGALQWHFAAMWLLAINGLFYLVMNISTGRLRAKLLPVRVSELFADMKAALTGKLVHADPRHYNAVQRAAYLFVTLDALLLMLSGLVIWKPVQFPLLHNLMGGFETARFVHFYAMAALVAFFVVHVVMVAIVPRTFIAMIRGR